MNEYTHFLRDFCPRKIQLLTAYTDYSSMPTRELPQSLIHFPFNCLEFRRVSQNSQLNEKINKQHKSTPTRRMKISGAEVLLCLHMRSLGIIITTNATTA